MFNLLTGPKLLDRVEALLPDHREWEFPPTETLSMFLAQALSADGSCRQAVNDATVKRLVGGLSAIAVPRGNAYPGLGITPVQFPIAKFAKSREPPNPGNRFPRRTVGTGKPGGS